MSRPPDSRFPRTLAPKPSGQRYTRRDFIDTAPSLLQRLTRWLRSNLTRSAR